MSGESGLTGEAIEHILKAMDNSLVPADIDRTSLQDDLESERAWYEVAAVLGDNTLARKREKRLKQIRNAAKTIADMDEDIWSLLHGTRCCFAPADPYREDPRDTARRLIEDVRRTFRPPARPENFAQDDDGLFVSEDSLFKGSPFERLAGWRLVLVFEKHFPGVAITYTRGADGSGFIDGAYVNFAFHALIKLGITNRNRNGDPYTVGAIADAVSKYRANVGRGRRKPSRP